MTPFPLAGVIWPLQPMTDVYKRQLFWFDENRFHGAGGTSYVLSGDEEIWDLARKIQETYPEYREAME